ncbi:MAG: hypothetical protein IPI02_22195 [Sterolibacteriaceae bacterium]|nr:hypothetical protein [Sterolibacteriaceae bacterium]
MAFSAFFSPPHEFTASDSKATIGLALAGADRSAPGKNGLGALSALAEALEGVDFKRLDVYEGVSAGGSLLRPGLNNGAAAQAAAMFVERNTR